MKNRECARSSAAFREKERQEKKILKSFEWQDDDVVIIVAAAPAKGNWEVEIRLPSGCKRRRPKKSKTKERKRK
jgi:hypothetical protein